MEPPPPPPTARQAALAQAASPSHPCHCLLPSHQPLPRRPASSTPHQQQILLSSAPLELSPWLSQQCCKQFCLLCDPMVRRRRPGHDVNSLKPELDRCDHPSTLFPSCTTPRSADTLTTRRTIPTICHRHRITILYRDTSCYLSRAPVFWL
jgi:hypothetical protein